MLNINPTRMELIRLKRKLKTAQRGHKLLKDKQDGLMKEFMLIIKKAKKARQEIEKKLGQAFKSFLFSSSQLEKKEIKEALVWPNLRITLEARKKNIMSVEIPRFTYQIKGKNYQCYSPFSTPLDIDESLKKFTETLPTLIELAEKEHSARLLSYEIEKTRRRVNALEHIFIPQMQQTIKYIETKLNEQERSNLVSLMKVKEKLET